MAHDHRHESANTYRAEQLFNVALCGALGAIMALMYFNGMVRYLFGPNEAHYQRVLLGAAGLLAIVLVRAGYVWRSIEAAPTHRPTVAGCGTDRGCPHGHDLGWAPTRFLLLGLPVFLFLLGWPIQGISGGVDVKLSAEELGQVEEPDRGGKGDGIQEVTFRQLGLVARDRGARERLTGQTIRVTGMYVGEDPAEFSLVRYSVNCCAADAIPVTIKVLINPANREDHQLQPARYQHKWVTVTGRLQFVYRLWASEYMPVLVLFPDEETPLSDLVKVVPAPAYPYVD